jgi:hypothetical protein
VHETIRIIIKCVSKKNPIFTNWAFIQSNNRFLTKAIKTHGDTMISLFIIPVMIFIFMNMNVNITTKICKHNFTLLLQAEIQGHEQNPTWKSFRAGASMLVGAEHMSSRGAKGKYIISA